MREHWAKLIRDAEKRTDFFLAVQNRDPASADYGSVSADFGYADPKPTLNYAATAISVYLNADSRYKGDQAIIKAAGLALDYAARVQNPEGTFDYKPCNFQSPPDTAFIINRIVVTRDLIAKSVSDTQIAALLPRFDAIILKAAEGMCSAGFHTPNHRWAIAAALSSCGRIGKTAKFKPVVERFLAEGIDGNESGEYAERSTGNYNVVNNDQMIILAIERNEASFLEYVDRNLEMMLDYLDPDQSIFTNNSTRQDRGVKTFLDQYFFNYLYMSKRLGNTLFSTIARTIMTGIVESGRTSPDCLDSVMLHFGGIEYDEKTVTIPDSYERYYRESGIVRVRNKGYSLSLMRDNGRFLYFQSGGITVYAKLGVAYFDKREFKATSIEKEGDAYVLRFVAEGWYYLPFEQKPPTSDWWVMDNKSRKRLHGPDLSFELTVTKRKEGDGIDMRVRVSGWQGVPLRFEFGIASAAKIEGDSFAVEARPGDALLAKNGFVHAKSGIDVLSIGPAFAEHDNIGGTYGSEGRSRDHFSLYCTAFSPLDRVISFKRTAPGEGAR